MSTDLIYNKDIKPTALDLVVINVGARLGVIGEAIELSNDEKWIDKLAIAGNELVRTNL